MTCMKSPKSTFALHSGLWAGLSRQAKKPRASTMTKNNTLPGSDDIVREVLPNGLVVLARENFTTPSVVINGLIQVGSIYETPEKAGLANIVAGALSRGTKTTGFVCVSLCY